MRVYSLTDNNTRTLFFWFLMAGAMWTIMPDVGVDVGSFEVDH